MPDTHNRRDRELAKYDAMGTEELQQLLREDASIPVGEESDTDTLLYIMEVLVKRRNERNEGKSPEEALESFKKNYDNEKENPSISESGSAVQMRDSSHWKRGLVAAVAVLVLIIGSSVTASALGFDVWEVVAKWTQETFHFSYAGQQDETDAPSPEFANPCASLQDALIEAKVTTNLVPKWLPAEYVEVDVRIEETPMQRRFSAKYQSGEDTIRIRIADYLNTAPAEVEQSDSLLEVYTSAGIDYYIISNEQQIQVIWIIETYECCISGPLTLSEVKEIIDSIEIEEG